MSIVDLLRGNANTATKTRPQAKAQDRANSKRSVNFSHNGRLSSILRGSGSVESEAKARELLNELGLKKPQAASEETGSSSVQSHVMPRDVVSLAGRIEGGLQEAYILARKSGEAWTLAFGPMLSLLNTLRRELAVMTKPPERAHDRAEWAGYYRKQEQISDQLGLLYSASSTGLDAAVGAMQLINSVLLWTLEYVTQDNKKASDGREVLTACLKIARAMNLDIDGLRAIQDLAFEGLLNKVRNYERVRLGVWQSANLLGRLLDTLIEGVKEVVEAIKKAIPEIAVPAGIGLAVAVVVGGVLLLLLARR